MTTATKERLRLDKFLQGYGSGIGTLTRIVGTTNQSPFNVDVRAHVREYKPEELTETIIQGDSIVIFGFTEIDTAQWPGPQTLPVVPGRDIRVPRRNDKFLWNGNQKNVEDAEAIYFDGVGVRINMQVRGQ